MNLLEETPIVFEIEELDEASRAIHERAVLRGKSFSSATAETLESIIEVDQNKVYEKFGCEHLTPYCVKFMGLDENLAGVLIRIARKSYAVPQLAEALISGAVSLSNAKTVASVITAENQSEWLKKAKTLSKAKLEREVFSLSPQKAKPEKARFVGGGRVQIILNLSEEEYEQHCHIKTLVSQSLGKSATDSDVEVAMMKSYIFYKDPVKKAERAAQRKSLSPNPPRGGSGDSPAAVVHVVNLRDQCSCRARKPDGTVCGSKKWTHLHHIIPRAEGGLNVPENLITLCSSHHRLWHKRHKSQEEVRGER